MSLFDISREELQGVLSHVEQALYNHQQWSSGVIRTLVCRLRSDQHDIKPESYKECRFGQWYYEQGIALLHEHPGFVGIGAAHQRMHELAARLLVAVNAGNPISALDYDGFANALERLRLEICTLQRELENTLFNHDPLTRALARVNILPLLREQQELVKRLGQPCCIAMMDLDLFKNINDLYGHLAGDQALSASARLVIEGLRPYDKVFRYGGDEFLLCMQQTELIAGYAIVERVREELAKLSIDIGQSEPIHLTVSFGLTLLAADVPVEQSIDRADKAMYAAKSAGRNCTRIWDPAM